MSAPRPMLLSPPEQARRHLMALFKHGLNVGEWIELRCLDCRTKPAGIGPRVYCRSVTDAVKAAMEHRDRWDVFFGVGLRRCPAHFDINRCPHPTVGGDHVSRLPAIWADLDVKGDDEPGKPHDSIESALELVTTSEPPADIAVCSGVGLHAYWTLSHPTHELERIEGVNRALRERFAADNAVDAARILRVAGTLNYKHGDPLPVRLMRCGNE